jgi:hypothetical protein
MVTKFTNTETEKGCVLESERIEFLREEPKRSAICRRVLVELPA